MNQKILLGPSSFAQLDSAPMDRLISAGFEVVNNPFSRKLTKQELLDLLPGVTGIIAGLELLDYEVMSKSSLKVISRCGSGMSNVDLDTAKKLGIKVFSTPFGPTSAVAELTVGTMLSLLRMVPQMDRDIHQGKWTKKIGLQLEGKTVVIVGFGRIGKKVASLLRPFHVKIYAVDTAQQGDVDGVKILTLEEALPISDIITIHSSGEEQIMGEDEFKLMKDGCFLLNAARGGLVNEESLIHALENGRIAGAWLDTFCTEPYAGSLCKFSQVILTPHVGSYTLECRRSMEMEAVNNLISAFKEIQ